MKFILITGASTGIGYEACKVFINNSYHVFGSVRKEADANRLKGELGESFTPLLFDVKDQKGIDEAVEVVRDKTGPNGLAGLINNAGMAVGGPIEFLKVDQFREQFEVNFFGLIAVTKAFLPLLGAVEDCTFPPGRIVNISSVSGIVAFPLLSPYCSSKHALEAFSNALRNEMIVYGIKVIIMGPGAIKTPIWDKGEKPSERVLKSIYGKGLEKLYNNSQKMKQTGLEADDFAEKLFKIFELKNPKYRYAILKNKFTNYILPKYLINTKLMAGFFKKMFI